jgi:hypothetical protein
MVGMIVISLFCLSQSFIAATLPVSAMLTAGIKAVKRRSARDAARTQKLPRPQCLQLSL